MKALSFRKTLTSKFRYCQVNYLLYHFVFVKTKRRFQEYLGAVRSRNICITLLKKVGSASKKILIYCFNNKQQKLTEKDIKTQI